MAAPPKYPTPHAQLLALAREAREAGVEFEAFWLRAVRPGLSAVTVATPPHRRPEGCVLWQRDTFDRNNARDAMEEAKEGWRRAYEGLPPSRAEMALIMLGPELVITERKARTVARLPDGGELAKDLLRRGLARAEPVPSAA